MRGYHYVILVFFRHVTEGRVNCLCVSKLKVVCLDYYYNFIDIAIAVKPTLIGFF